MRSRASRPRLRPSVEPYAEPPSDVGYESSQPPAFDSTEAPPAPAFEPPVDEPEAEPFTDAEPQPFAEAQPAVAPRIEPWSPDSDPWGAAWTVPPAVDETTVDEHVAEEHADEAPPVEEAGVEDELDAGVVSAASSTDAWQAAELEPDLEPEPPPTQDDSHEGRIGLRRGGHRGHGARKRDRRDSGAGPGRLAR